MSEDESFNASGGHYHSANITSENEVNDSIIQKVKSKVSSILPQTFSKWFSPINNLDENRNGNIRRRRCEDDSLNDSDQEDIQSDKCNNVLMPPVKKSRLNYDEPNQFMLTKQYAKKMETNKFISSTPMLDIRGRKDLHNERYQGPVFISPANKMPMPINDIEEETDIIEVVQKFQPKHNQMRRNTNLNIRSMPTEMMTDQNKRSKSSIENNVSLMNENSIIKGKSSMYCVQNADVEEECDNDENEDEIEDDEEENEKKEWNPRNKDHSTNKLNILSNGTTNNANVHMIRNENQDSASESGESQCSSFAKQSLAGRIKSGRLFSSDKTKNLALNQSKTMTNGFNFYSHLEGKKSLFSSKNMHSVLNNSTMSLTSLNRRQQFNASLYGSTSALSDSRLLNTSSPFYKGRTTYGGASAYGNPFMSSSARQIRIAPTLIRPSSRLSNFSNSSQDLNKSNVMINDKNLTNSTAISSTAKRILELMDQFTTPLNEARKMADSLKNSQILNSKKRFTESDYLANKTSSPGIRLQKPRTPYSRPQETKQNENTLPPIAELQVPSMAQLLQLKTLQANTERNRELANSNIKSVLNQKTDQKIAKDHFGSNKIMSANSGKIKNKITSTRPSAKNLDEMETSETVDLPNIQLPMMKSIPKIDILLQPSKSQQDDKQKNLNALYSHKNTTNSKTKMQFELKSSNENNFIFSSPMKVKNGIDPKLICSSKNFKFSKPRSVETHKNLTTSLKIAQKTDEINFTPNNLKQQKLTDSTDNINSGPKKLLNSESPKAIPQLKSGSVLDALKKSNVYNEQKTFDNKSNKIGEQNKDVKKTSGFGDAFKKPVNQWECTTCMIRNDEKLDKCVACATLRKVDNSKNVPVSFGSDLSNKKNSLSEQFKTKPNTWECSACMIRNTDENLKCVACNTLKRGTNNNTKKINDSITINDNKIIKSTETIKPLDNNFKHLVAQQNSKWECSACMTRNDPNRAKCVCCEQTKPGSGNASGNSSFSFGAAASKFTFGFNKITENTLKETEEKSNPKTESFVTSQSNTSFKLSTPSSNTNVTSSSNPIIFGFSTTEKKLPEIKTTTETAKATLAPGGFSFGFGKPSASENNITKPGVDGSNDSNKKPLFGALANANKSTELPKLGLIPKTDETDSKTKSFSFSSPNTSNIKNDQPSATINSTTIATTAFTFGSAKQNETASTTASNTGFSFSTPATSTSTLTTASATINPSSTASLTSPSFVFGSSKPLVGNSTSLFGTSTVSLTNSTLTDPVTTNTTNLKSSIVSTATTKTWSSGFGSPSSLNNQTNSTTLNTTQSNQISSGFGNMTNNNIQDSKNSLGTNNQLPSSNVFQFGSSSSTNNMNNNSNNANNVNNSNNNSNINNTNNNLINNVKSAETGIPVFGSPTSNNASANKQFTFGSSSNVGPVFGSKSNTQSTTAFVFGSPKIAGDSNVTNNTTSCTNTNNNNSIFGSVNNSNNNNNIINNSNNSNNNNNNTNSSNNNNNTFGSSSFGNSSFGSQQLSNSTFGQTNSMPNSNLFSNNSLQQQQPQQSKPSSSFSASNSCNLFGSATTVGTSSPFGTAANASTFGTLAAPPTFGNTSSTTPTFGSATSAPTFGSSNNNAAFGMSAQDTVRKTNETPFNFGATNQNPIRAGFSFGNSNSPKPAFNFTAQASPKFNFTGAVEATNSSQPFQFGAYSNTAPIPTVFNFGNTETPSNAPFTFNAPTNNIFAPTPTTGSQSTSQARRKIRSATRRNQPR